MPKIEAELNDIQKLLGHVQELKIELRAMENLKRICEERQRRIEQHRAMEP